jgi:hypothetical protein
LLSPDQVSAVIVTRGDVDLGPVLDSLIFDDVVVWDNSKEPEDQGTYGRSLATLRARHPVVYSQDDDIVHTPQNQRTIVGAYEPRILTGCMWPEWSAGARQQGIEGGYDDLVFAGAGSVYDAATVHWAAAKYTDVFPFDDWFRLWADTIIGVIAPTKQLDVRFEALPHAEAPNRMCNLPDAAAEKKRAIERAREVRDRLLVPA